MQRLKPLVAAGTDLCLLHHKRKAQQGAPTSDADDIRGSGDIRAFADSVLFLRPLAESKVTVRHNKARRSTKQEPFVFSVTNADTGGVVFAHEGVPADVLDKTAGCREVILLFAQQRGTMKRREIEAELKGRFSRKVFDPVLKELSEAGYPLRKYRVGREDLYVFMASDPTGEEASNEEAEVPF